MIMLFVVPLCFHGFIDCCLMVGISRFNRKLEERIRGGFHCEQKRDCGN